ncbi:MAG: hypothetical protein QI223_03455 [Candidatus Korarchaeota archaeon]|nr:hypothetical protein [Candidatus Korarchaeota archaeon]
MLGRGGLDEAASYIGLALEDLASARFNLSKAEEILEREGVEVGLEDRVREVDEIIGRLLEASRRLGI